MTSSITATHDRMVRSGGKDSAPHTCDVCAHASEGHDPISDRYCAATLANALTRHCICT
ncbi:RGCVC family protein [Cryptosporangium sp. NPDC048952]|uniref:RGCVC family protein n=1 Tax=Cryptosporangium sp. NPDC048952 TaxID=3363961 RepID=UPI00371652C0